MLRKGQGKVRVKSRQHNHNINQHYNLMGFDTIEINLVFSQIRSEGGVIKSQFFPKFKIVYIILGGGEGARKLPHSAQLENFSSA